MSDDIKLYKTISGQELVARVVEKGIGWVVLDTVLAIQVRQTGPDSYQLGFGPFSAAAPQGQWKVPTSLLLGEATECPPELLRAYIQETSGIEIVANLGGLK